MTELPLVERIRTARQNHTVAHDFEWPTPQQRDADIARAQAHESEFAASERRKFWS